MQIIQLENVKMTAMNSRMQINQNEKHDKS